ncbi:hypothetical protein EAI_07114 [Harpegnathos saltator]|uniref:Uncharacterized protein n=1 Tax=Harpegnathos saltator TaxID=610380 RepID=E2BJL4_HARSA|nr:hypothetical protein EAI_07114 [Harpegnathos saltator]
MQIGLRASKDRTTFEPTIKLSGNTSTGIQFDFATWEKFKEYERMKHVGDYLHSVIRVVPEPAHINDMTITFTTVYGVRIMVSENTKTAKANTASKKMPIDSSQAQQPPTKKRKVYTVNIVMQTSFDGLELITKCSDAQCEQLQSFAKLVNDCARFLVTEIELRLPKKYLQRTCQNRPEPI